MFARVTMFFRSLTRLRVLLGLLITVILIPILIGAIGDTLGESFKSLIGRGRRVQVLLESAESHLARNEPRKAIELLDEILRMPEATSDDRRRAIRAQGRSFIAIADAGESQRVNLQNAISTLQKSAGSGPEVMSAQELAGVYLDLGDAHLRMAEVTQQAPNLAGAVDAYSRAIDISAVSDQPRVAVVAQTGITMARVRRSQFAPGAGGNSDIETALDDAIRALRIALAPIRHDRKCLEWGKAQDALSAAYCALGQIRPGQSQALANIAIERAAEAQSALDGDRYPYELAIALRNAGNAHRLLSLTTDGDLNLNKALDLYESSARWFKARRPFDYAKTELTIAAMYPLLAERRDPEANYRKALGAADAALETFTVDYPVYYAAAHYNRGIILAALSEHGETVARTEEAIRSFDEWLRVNANNPMQVTVGRLQSAAAHVKHGAATNSAAEIEQAIVALEELNKHPTPYRLKIAISIGEAHYELARVGGSAVHLDRAVVELAQAVERMRPAVHPLDYATTASLLGEALSLQAIRRKDRAAMDRAYKICSSALAVAHAHGFGKIEAQTQSTMQELRKAYEQPG